MKTFTTLVFCLLLQICGFAVARSFAQTDPIRFYNEIRNPNYASFYHLTHSVTDKAFNTYITGYCVNDFTDHDIVLIKLDSKGETVFRKELDSPGKQGKQDIPSAIHMDGQDNIFLVAESKSKNSQGEPVIIKLSPSGEIIWTYHHFKENTEFSNIHYSSVDADGNSYFIASHNGNGLDFIVVASNGEKLRQFTIRDEYAQDYQYLIDSNNKALYYYNSFEIYKLDFSGEEIWSYRTLHRHNMDPGKLLVNPNNECFIMGDGYDEATYQKYYKAIKLSSSGNVLWEQKVNHSAYNSYFSAAHLNSKGELIAAYLNQSADGKGSIQFLHFNNQGAFIKQGNIASEEGPWIQLNEFVLDENDDIYLSGLDCSDRPIFKTSINKPFMAKLDYAFNLKWKNTIEIKENSQNTPTKIIISAPSQISFLYQTGYSVVSNINYKTDNQSSLLTLASDGQSIGEQTFESQGISSCSPVDIKKDANGNHFVISISHLRTKEKQLEVFKYDQSGKKLWMYKYENPNGYDLSYIKAFTLSNNDLKVFINLKGFENGEYIDYHTAITVSSEGLLQSTNDYQASSNQFRITNMKNDHFYLQYWMGGNNVLSCRDQNDNEVWQKTLNQDADLTGATILGIDNSSNLFLHVPSKFWKIDLNGVKVWAYDITNAELLTKGLDFDKDGNIIFWFNKKVGYSDSEFQLHKLAPDGASLLSVNTTDITTCIRVWPRNDGGFSVFGELNEKIYDRFSDLSTLYSMDEAGNLLSLHELNINPYHYGPYGSCTTEISSNSESLYITTPNKLMKFGDQGRFLGSLSIDQLSYQAANTYYQRILNIEPNEIILLGRVNSEGNLINKEWSAGFTLALNTSDLDNEYLNNTAPQFIDFPDTVNVVSGFPTQYLYATDDQDDVIFYTKTSDTGGFFAINPGYGYITSDYSTPPRGIYTVVLRATDIHGAYSEKKVTFIIGEDNEPFIYSLPVGYSRANSYYSYQVIGIDEDDDKLFYSLSENTPTWLSINSESGLLAGIPPMELANSSVMVEIIVTEPLFSDLVRQSYSLFIDKPNIAPNFSTFPEDKANLNEKYSYEITYTDPEDDLCKVSIRKAPGWLKFNNSTGKLTGTPLKGDFYGNNELVIELNDGFGGITTLTHRITIVHPTNVSPAFTSEPIIQTYPGLNYSYSVYATDPDGDEISILLTSSPSFIWHSNNSLRGRAEDQDVGEHEISLDAYDYFGSKSTQKFTLKVSPLPENLSNFDFDITISINQMEIYLDNYIGSQTTISISNMKGESLIEPISHYVTSDTKNMVINTTNFIKDTYIIQVVTPKKHHLKHFSIQ